MPYQPPNSKATSSYNTLMSHKNASSSRFYLMDDEATSKESVASSSNQSSLQEPSFPFNRMMASRSPSLTNVPLPPAHLDSENKAKLAKLLRFVTESSQSYSYTLMSTNSMALRLKVLKRSLEILLGNHDLLNSSLNQQQYYSNASTSTLQSLLSTTSTAQQVPNNLNHLNSSTNLTLSNGSQTLNVNKSLLKDLKEFVKMLDSGVDSLDISLQQKDTLLQLHNLSLTDVDNNPNNENSNSSHHHSSKNHNSRKQGLRRQLLHALAMPFIEQQQQFIPNPIFKDNTELEIQSQSSSRQIHSSATGKTHSPKAIFTINSNSPWNIININDIGLLMFGISKSALGRTQFIDLIAPRSRDLVYKRLQRESDLVFSGEVIAVKRDNMSIAWISVWAKRINDRIYMIFEQINCDIIDLIIEKINNDDEYTVQNVLSQSKDFYKQDLGHTNLNRFLPSVSNALNCHPIIKTASGYDEDLSYHDSNIINKIRYFTLKTEFGEYYPCALTSESMLEIDNPISSETSSLIRINLHALPYIAGSFVISAKSHSILSHNEAIAKNLFGRGLLQDKSIDSILPGFDALLKLAENENPNMSCQEGLILPEHYFRKLTIWKQNLALETMEEQFLKCRGIEGLHNDGNKLLVDVQLRVAQSEVYVLWITFSRTIPGSFKTSMNTMPSQLQLRNMDKDDSANDLFKNSNNSNSTTKLTLSPLKKRISSSSTLGNSSVSSIDADLSQPSTAKSTSELLESEEELLEDLRRECPHFPKEVGLEKRKKTVDDFEILKDLGSGAYGKVWMGRHKQDKLYEVCIKSIVKERILVDTWVRDRNLGTIPSEIQILYTISKRPHGNLLRMIDYFEDSDYYHLETLPVPNTIDLYDLIELKKDSMNERECAYIFFQLCSAVKHLHYMGIIHRDIKDENIIVDNELSVKLIDFGSSAFIRDGPFRVFLGTLEYASPEVLDGSLYEGKKQDIWAMGVLLFTLIFKENPFLQVDEILEAKLNIPIHTHVSDECLQLIKMILVEEPDRRPSIDDILQHDWLKGFK